MYTMNRRIEFHDILCEILESRNVYFQPPESIKMKYPAIVYSISDISNSFADNGVYNQRTLYEVTVIDKNPDNETIYKLSKMPGCHYNRRFLNDNLNHDVFLIYY